MKALAYILHGKFALTEKPKPEILDPRNAIVRVTLGSICTSSMVIYRLRRSYKHYLNTAHEK